MLSEVSVCALAQQEALPSSYFITVCVICALPKEISHGC